MPEFDYQGALDAGYSEDEIADYLTQSRPNFDVKGAREAGYSLQEINEHLRNTSPKEQPERNALEKGARMATQYGLGRLEGTVPGLVYDIATLPSGSQAFSTFNARIRIGEDIEGLYEKNAGKSFEEWPKEDQELYASLEEQIKPGAQPKDVKAGPDLSLQSIAETVTGVDLNPEDIAEKAARWTGWIKDPRSLFELGKTGLTKKDLAKAIFPTSTEMLRGAAAGTALQIAKEGGFGPIGSLAFAVMSDIAGHYTGEGLKQVAKIVMNPREALAEIASKFTKQDKLALQKQVIQDFRNANIQADIGTITDSNLIKWTQSRLAQSGLTGRALDDLKKTITEEIKGEYKQIADSLGNARFTTLHEAGESTRNYMQQLRDADLNEVRQFYKSAENSLKPDSYVSTQRLAKSVNKIEKALLPGQLKSGEQTAVLDILEKLKRDIFDSSGNPISTHAKDLMNDKIALNDIINYEVQGGQKQLLKELVGEIDRTLINHGKANPAFGKNYILANKRSSDHAKTFRNKRVSSLLKDNDPAQLMNKMNSVQGIRDIEKILSKSKQGQELFNDLKRFKLDRMIEDNFIDSTTQQIKLGTFSKLLDKGKNREVAREILPKGSYVRLKNLQKNAGRLAESAEKFLNASKSGVTATDVGIVTKVIFDLSNLVSGNPWPILKSGGSLVSARYLSKLMGDPQFLKLVEDFVLAAQKNNTSAMTALAKELSPMVRVALQEEEE